ncbi:tetratricopeptide repeat protein, partial [Phytoactinopolyspora endophytica]|uniref:tetratricopeptide repeat protein n=1 Tax=Phytoactinopolyspora endophytica TaxID=1642495 RepID=UPI00197C5C38
DLAASLHNQSDRLAENGQQQEALTAIEEAATTRRQLAQANPSTYEPDLAASLHNLSNRLAENGQREDADRITQERRALATVPKGGSVRLEPNG